MKKKLLLLILVLLTTTQMIYSQVPSYVPSNGLVGYWPFNGNANDQTPSGYNGTVNGATLTTDRFGNNNSAYNFDGINDYILVNNNASLSPIVYSISAWVKPNGYYINGQDDANYIVGKGSDFNDGHYSLHYKSISRKARASIGIGSSGLYVDSNADINLNNWVHLISTWDGNTLRIYVNGVLENSIYSPNNVQGVNSENLYFGTMAANSTWPYWLNGKIDDIAIYNRALTQQEITNMYNGVNYSDTCNAVSGSLTNGLVGYWPFCGNANDDSGNGNNGVVDGATLTTDRFGNANSAYSFDGSNKIAVPNLQSYLFNSKITISAWVNLSSIPNSKFNLVTKYGGAGFDDAFSLDVTSTNYQLNISPGSTSWTTCVGNSSIQTNQWHNLVGVYDYSNNIFKIYLDGVLLGSNTALSAMGNALSAKVIFGYYDDPLLVSPNQQFNGKLDDIGIWNRALSPQEITQLYNQNQCITNITVTDTLIINVGQLSYTNPVTYANNITIYPNPANTQVNISFNNISNLTGGHINIINSLGQQVTTTPITLSGTNTTLSLNTWGGTGLYFVQIVNAQGQIVDIKKIILQ